MATTYLQRLLAKDEKILYVTRQHWLIYLRAILVEILIFFILVAVTILVILFAPPTTPAILKAIPIVLCVIPILGGVRDFLIWWNDQDIITNRRVIQLSGIINKDVTDSSLEKVNDVKMEQTFLGRLFNFGDVEILTGSELGANLFKFTTNPVRFKTTMLNAKADLERAMVTPLPSPTAPEKDVPAMIAELDALRQKGILTEAEFQNKKAELLKKL
jgi:uncharacterized membrane protein YdbT with pleckstrin-like domain